MTLGEKLRYLREVEGALRGLGRAMNQSEVVRKIHDELGSTITQAYLSQVENGRRKHLTDTTRMLLARFFKVHPGYLVNDPEGFHPELQSALRATEDSLDLWLINGAERFAADTEISQALVAMARHSDSRKCILLMHEILEEPGLPDRLLEALQTPRKENNNRKPSRPLQKRGQRSAK